MCCMSVGAGFYKFTILVQVLFPVQLPLHGRTKEWVEDFFYKEMRCDDEAIWKVKYMKK